MLEENKTLVRRYYTEVTGDLSGIGQVVSDTFVDHHMPPDLPPGPAGVHRFFKDILGGIFSGMRIDIEFMIAEGDKVDCHFVVTFQHIGEFAGIMPRGNTVRLPAISTFRIDNAKLAEAWEIYDKDDMLQQMRA